MTGKSDEEKDEDHQNKRLRKDLDTKIEQGMLFKLDERPRHKPGMLLPVPFGSTSLPVAVDGDSQFQLIYELQFKAAKDEEELDHFATFRASRIAAEAVHSEAAVATGRLTILNTELGQGDDADDPEDPDYDAPGENCSYF